MKWKRSKRTKRFRITFFVSFYYNTLISNILSMVIVASELWIGMGQKVSVCMYVYEWLVCRKGKKRRRTTTIITLGKIERDEWKIEGQSCKNQSHTEHFILHWAIFFCRFVIVSGFSWMICRSLSRFFDLLLGDTRFALALSFIVDLFRIYFNLVCGSFGMVHWSIWWCCCCFRWRF